MLRTGALIALLSLLAPACAKEQAKEKTADSAEKKKHSKPTDDTTGADADAKAAGDKPAAENKQPPAPKVIDSLAAMTAVEVTLASESTGALTRQKLGKDVPQLASFDAIDFVGEEHGFASGNYATLLETRDGGNSWKVLTTKQSAMRDRHGRVLFTGPEHGVTIEAGTLKLTEDGGKSWTLSPTAPELTRVFFTGRDDGWGLARDRVVRTRDGGKTWKPVFMPSGSFFADIHIGADGNGWLMGQTRNKLAVWRTTDGGQSWVDVIAMKEDTSHEAHGMHVVSGDEMWLAGGGYVIGSKDGGTTWSRFDGLHSGDAQFHDIVVSGEKLWLAGFDPAAGKAFLLASSDGGKSWAPIDTKLKPNEFIHDLHLHGDRLWAAGSGIHSVAGN